MKKCYYNIIILFLEVTLKMSCIKKRKMEQKKNEEEQEHTDCRIVKCKWKRDRTLEKYQ